MTQVSLVPLETMDEKITDSLSQAIWCMDLKLLAAARPPISTGPLRDILESKPRTVPLARVLGISLLPFPKFQEWGQTG